MDYIFRHPADLNGYTADAVVVRCVDDRFWKAFKAFMRSLNITRLDQYTAAGGAAVFSTPQFPGIRDFMRHQMQISVKSHRAKKALLFTHHDCLYFGGFARFQNRKLELECHLQEHCKVKDLVEKWFPDLPVETFFIDDVGIIRTF